MLYREIIAVCSQIHTKHTNALCGQNAEYLNVKLGDTHVKCPLNLNVHNHARAVPRHALTVWQSPTRATRVRLLRQLQSSRYARLSEKLPRKDGAHLMLRAVRCCTDVIPPYFNPFKYQQYPGIFLSNVHGYHKDI
jgi:hypothetical protein